MTHVKRSRRLQAGLAGLSILSALAAAVGLGLTTHTGTTAQASQGGNGNGASSTGSGSHEGGEGNDDGTRSGTTTSNKQQRSPVTQPAPTAPQATTSGS